MVSPSLSRSLARSRLTHLSQLYSGIHTLATLTRPKTAPAASTQSAVLLSGVPAPFSQEELDQIQLNGSSPSQIEESSAPGEAVRNDWTPSEGEELPQEESLTVLVS